MSSTADILQRQKELQREIAVRCQNGADLEDIVVLWNELDSRNTKLTGKSGKSPLLCHQYVRDFAAVMRSCT